ncbi:hypothetical protein [Paragemmobacter straminiformis]|uniref:Uncharacterized protein n=1 Tax=Paragemmobacter straminiformis TaxID=2045119 RepID=A0A842IFY4_9RHOB|nr:hypothetical protein [Gemmobacter straminiformis]MBC2837468.1 hypothetical protein [Gemmobacter straminiformis]
MRNIILTSTLVLAALSGAASASSLQPRYNAGDAQLALTAGVQPGEYSRAELINILDAQRENDATRLNFYLSGANRTTNAADPAAVAQIAASAGVQGGDYSVAELQRLIDARSEGDAATVDFIVNRAGKAANAAEVVTPGEAQLAAVIGVDPAQYTLAQLIALQPEND